MHKGGIFRSGFLFLDENWQMFADGKPVVRRCGIRECLVILVGCAKLTNLGGRLNGRNGRPDTSGLSSRVLQCVWVFGVMPDGPGIDRHVAGRMA